MYTRLLSVLSAAAFVVAQCNNGKISCCTSVQQAHEVPGLQDMSGWTIDQAAVQGLVGLICTPLTAIGSGQGCSAHQVSVCCTEDKWHGIINLGCSTLG
ncbi:hypothetical protein SCLCIDRAFT_1210971 [Scleroderma citrinum Foug A]|uniref:Hydrophobin n=1 Tax=Scleroderma citrinum Foug A TaxID=1036808 RepID=A0A0C3EG62_9AGAM|nr:hypothetical protein SCLCIDRAFT_1210971 [Scleroderma citrinum Foug A]